METTVDWDHQTVIGKKTRQPKVAKNESDVNAVRTLPSDVECLFSHPVFYQARRLGAVVGTDRKTAGGTNKAHQSTDHQKIAKVDRENEVAPPPKISLTVGKAIQQARMEKGLSQKDCAQKINEKPSVLQDYESGKAIPNTQILSKLERALGVKLRGSDIGKKLEGPKKS